MLGTWFRGLFFSTAAVGAFQSSMLVSCSLGSPLLYGSQIVFLDFGHPRFRNFYSIDVARVKSYEDHDQ